MITYLTRTPSGRYAPGENGILESIDTVEAYGLSTDTKPTQFIANASVFFEMDTKTTFFFDEENGRWL